MDKKIIIFGKKLFIRPLLIKDASVQYLSWFKNSQNYQYIETVKKVKKKNIQYLKSYILSFKKNRNKILFGIFAKKNLSHIGNISLQFQKIKKNIVLGIFIGDKKYRKRGIGKESMNLIINYYFKNSSFKSFTLGVKKDNKPAMKLYRRIGFKLLKKKKEGFYLFLDRKTKINKV